VVGPACATIGVADSMRTNAVVRSFEAAEEKMVGCILDLWEVMRCRGELGFVEEVNG